MYIFDGQGRRLQEEHLDFIEFEENNEWECEQWSFWIPLQGNEEGIALLQSFIRKIEQHENWNGQYFVCTGSTPESEVDILVKHSRSCYMDFHNKLSGKFDLEKLRAAIEKYYETDGEDDPFYKGGIENFLKKEGS